MKSFFISVGQLVSFLLAVRVFIWGCSEEGPVLIAINTLGFLFVSAFVALVKLDIKEDESA